MIKLLHVGDVHLHNGPLFQEIKKCCLYILKKAEEEKPDMIVISGDLFDLLRDRLSLRIGTPATLFAADFVQGLADIAPVLIILGTLTHDPPDSIVVFKKLKTKFPVHVALSLEQVGFRKKSMEFMEINPDSPAEGYSVIISCLPSVTKATVMSKTAMKDEGQHTTEELTRDVLQMWGVVNERAREVGIPTILSGHCTVRGSITSTGQKMIGKDLEVCISDLKLAKCDIYCLNHIHKAQEVGPGMFYSGSVTRLDHGETEAKGFYIHEVEAFKPLVSRFIETPARVMKTLIADGLPNEAMLDEVNPGDIVRISYTMREDENALVDEQALKQIALANGAVDVTFQRETILIRRSRAEGISKLNSLEEKLVKWGEIAQQEITDPLKEKLDLLVKTDLDMILNGYSGSTKQEVHDEAGKIAA